LKQSHIFEVYQLSPYHYRIELREKNSSLYSHAVFYLPLRELYILHSVEGEILEAILGFVEKEFGRVETIIKI